METVAKFERVSETRFVEDWISSMGGDAQAARMMYALLRLPVRATSGSAGYDFFAPAALTVEPGTSVRVPTGIRARIAAGWLLAVFPRSGLGFRYRLQLDNTVGIVDSDYYGAENEGHILIQVSNASHEKKPLSLRAGEGFAQGIFLPFGIAEGDRAEDVRRGGFGSTTPYQE